MVSIRFFIVSPMPAIMVAEDDNDDSDGKVDGAHDRLETWVVVVVAVVVDDDGSIFVLEEVTVDAENIPPSISVDD